MAPPLRQFFAISHGMRQLNFFKTNQLKEHGGSLSLGKRKSRRPLTIKTPIHLVLKSDFALGARSLLRHRPLIEKIIKNAKNRFNVKVYEFAIVSNHIHLLIKGQTRLELQNFFRVVAGHIAQEVLRRHPIEENEKKGNKFWNSRVYSRIVSWGREYLSVRKYVIQNTLEALRIISYNERKRPKRAKLPIAGRCPHS